MPVRSVIFDIIGRDNASKAFLSAAAAADRTAGATERSIARMNAAGLRMQTVGQRISKGFTLPVVAAAAVSIDQAAKFQKSMTLIQTAGGETVAKASAISKGIMRVATQTGTSLDQLSQGIYTVAKAGGQKWTAAEQLTVLKAAAQGAKAENVDLGTSVSALTSVMMSYHVPAKDAVSVQNELIRGAGLAKTTMQEYAGSLATVIPIASSAGIKFDQVAGAVATLTQHGTSAQEATQELANTIRNMQAPNTVAIKAMQQLGLNVNDVEKNLGKRGLTGTIDLVTNAISKKMGPSGLVAVSAFKQSQSASADLTLELSKMPKPLADISHQFETGKLSYKQYYLDVKSLGGQQYELGKNFISTMTQAKGFNDLLRRGSPAAATFAAYLKQVMGGATGLNTALQLGGENMGYFKSATDQVAKAAHESGADVLGWAKTQDTFAVKVDKAKANLQVLAVEIGTALIPAVSKVVGWVTKAVDWFDQLGSGWKKTVGYSVLVVAALGPILSIGGRIIRMGSLLWKALLVPTRFFAGVRGAQASMTGMSSSAYGAGTRVRGAFTGMGESAAATARTVATAEETQTRAIIAGTDAQIAAIERLRAVGAAMPVGPSSRLPLAYGAGVGGAGAMGSRSGLARGLVMGGGFGLMIGGQYLGSAIDNHVKGSGRNRAATGVSDAGMGALIGSFAGPEGLAAGAAIGGIYGAVNAGKNPFGKLFGSIKDIASVSRSSAAATKAWTADILASGSASNTAGVQIAAAAVDHDKLTAAATKAGLTQKDLTNAITGTNAGYAQTVAAWKAQGNPSRQQLAALASLRKGYLDAGRAAVQQALAQGRVIPSMVKTGTLADLLTGKLVNLNRSHMTGASAAAAFRGNLTSLSAAVRLNGRTLDQDTSFGRSNAIALKTAAAGAVAHAQAVYRQTGSLKAAQSALTADRSALIASATAAGLNRDQVARLVSELFQIPSDPHSKVIVDTASAQADLYSVLTTMRTIGQGVTGEVIIHTVNAATGAANTVHARASGGGLPEGWSSINERGPELLYKSGPDVQVIPHARAKAIVAATGMRAPGFAGGTKPDTEKIGTAIGLIGQAYTKPIDLASVTAPRIRAQIANAVAVLDAQIHAGLSRASASSFVREINSLRAEADKQLSDLRLKIRGTDVSALRSALKGTVDDTRQAISQMVADLYGEGVSRPLRLLFVDAAHRLESVQAKYQAAVGYRSDVRSTLAGTFDPTQYGSVTDLVAGLGGAKSTNNAFAAEVSKLRGEAAGNSTLLGFVNSLAASGQSTTLQTLAGASKAQLTQVAKAVGGYQDSLTAGSNAAEIAKYGTSVDTLAKQQSDLTDAIAGLAASAYKLAGRDNVVELDGREIARGVVNDPEFIRMIDHLSALAHYGRK